MTEDQREIRRKKGVIEYAEKIGHVAGWVVQTIYFRFAFAILAVLVASGYANLSRL